MRQARLCSSGVTVPDTGGHCGHPPPDGEKSAAIVGKISLKSGNNEPREFLSSPGQAGARGGRGTTFNDSLIESPP